MDVYSDDLEIVVIGPAVIQTLLRLKESRKQHGAEEKAFADALAAAVTAFQEVTEALARVAATIFDATRALDNSAKASMRTQEIADKMLDADDQVLKNWEAAQRRFSQVEIVRCRQFERERTNRCARMCGNLKGRRKWAGPKKAKKHKVGKGGGWNAAGRQKDGRNNRCGGEAGACSGKSANAATRAWKGVV